MKITNITRTQRGSSKYYTTTFYMTIYKTGTYSANVSNGGITTVKHLDLLRRDIGSVTDVPYDIEIQCRDDLSPPLSFPVTLTVTENNNIVFEKYISDINDY